MTDIWIPIRGGACVWFAKPDALKGSLVNTLLAARPTLFVGVPRFVLHVLMCFFFNKS